MVVVVDDDEVGVVSPMRIKSLYDCVCSSMSMESVRTGTWAGVGRGRRSGLAAARWKVVPSTRQVQVQQGRLYDVNSKKFGDE